MNKSFKIICSIIITIVLLFVGFELFLTGSNKKIFTEISFKSHILLLLFVIPIFIMGGIELKLLFKKVSNIKLDLYDVLTLPFVISLWGIIIPLQGSVLYTISYIHSKYKKEISEGIKVYILSFSIGLSLTGLIGVLYCFFGGSHYSFLFLLISIVLFINPLFLVTLNYILKKNVIKLKSGIIKKVIMKFKFDMKFDMKFIINILLIKMTNALLTAIWSLWISQVLKLNFTFSQLVLISFLMNLVLLVKITPGNLGVNQFVSGGIALLVGGTMRDGFLLSTFQVLYTIIMALLIGTTFSIFNFQYFNFRILKQLFQIHK